MRGSSPRKLRLAGGFGIREQSAIGGGLSFRSRDVPLRPIGDVLNPAAVNVVDGLMSSSSLALILPNSEMTARAGTSPGLLALGPNSGNIGQAALIAGSYFAYRLSPDWALGLAVTAPFGTVTKPDIPWAGQSLAITAKALFLDFNPVIGYRVTDWLNIAAGPTLVYAKATFTRDVAPDPFFPGIQVGRIDGVDDRGVGFTAGVTVKPWTGGEISLGYRSPVDLKLGGNIKLPGPPSPPISRSRWTAS